MALYTTTLGENEMDIRNLRVGDRIEFKACTRSHYRKAIRIITGFCEWNGNVEVRYHGWGDFQLRSREIIRKVDA